jgi:hypothetical protein
MPGSGSEMIFTAAPTAVDVTHATGVSNVSGCCWHSCCCLRTCCCLASQLWPGIHVVTGFPSDVNNPFAYVFSNFSLQLLVCQMSGVAVAGIPADVGLYC